MSWNGVKSAMLFTAIGAVAVVALIAGNQRKEIIRLKVVGDSIQAAAVVRDSAAAAEAAASARRVDSLQSTKRRESVRLSASRDSLRRALDGGLASAHDTIVNQAAQIVLQDSVITELRENAKTDSLSLWEAMGRGDRLLDSLRVQTAAVVVLNGQIQRLNQHTLPKWLRVSFDVAVKALAAKEIVDLARGK